MIRNTHVALHPTSGFRRDAINTLRYTLFLDHKIPDIDDGEFDPDKIQRFFTHIMERVQMCCGGLFVDRKENGDMDTIYYNFFGTDMLNGKVKSPLSYLGRFPAIDDTGRSKDMPGLHDMILQHCIFSSYHAVLTGLTKDQRISSYKMENNIKGRGIHSLYKDGKISFDTGGIVLHKKNEDPLKKNEDPSKENCSKASNLSGKIGRRMGAIPGVMGFFTEKTGKTSYGCFPQFLQTCQYICDMKSCNFNLFKNEKKIGPLLDSIENLTCGLEPRIGSLDEIPERAFGKFGGDVVDALYHYYITERVFNLNLFYALVKNIRSIEMETSYRLCQESIIRVLTCCKDLPNVFSRQYFLKYAFDKIKDGDGVASHKDFWHERHSHKLGILTHNVRENIMCFDLMKWLEQYGLFVGYISSFMIPIYEWCFIDMLLGVIEKKYPDKGHVGHLEKAFEMLSCYIEKEYVSMIQPIKLEKEMDLVDVVSGHTDTVFFSDLPEDSLRQMIDALIMSDIDPDGGGGIELNLQILDPAFFDDRKGNPCNNHYKNVRNMYTNFVRIMCAEKYKI